MKNLVPLHELKRAERSGLPFPCDLSDLEIQKLADHVVEEIRSLGRRRVSKRKILEIVEINLRGWKMEAG